MRHIYNFIRNLTARAGPNPVPHAGKQTWILTLPLVDENGDAVDSDAVYNAISDHFGFNYSDIKLRPYELR